MKHPVYLTNSKYCYLAGCTDLYAYKFHNNVPSITRINSKM